MFPQVAWIKAGVIGIQIEQRAEIAPPARVQPIHDNGYRVKILGHVRHAFHILHPAELSGDGGIIRDRGEPALNRELGPENAMSGRGPQDFCCARSHTPNAVTNAPASANQVMAYCR